MVRKKKVKEPPEPPELPEPPRKRRHRHRNNAIQRINRRNLREQQEQQQIADEVSVKRLHSSPISLHFRSRLSKRTLKKDTSHIVMVSAIISKSYKVWS